jgi:hypothetical protein
MLGKQEILTEVGTFMSLVDIGYIKQSSLYGNMVGFALIEIRIRVELS